MDGGMGGIGPVSRQFLWKCAKMAKDTGADKWIERFWDAANAGKKSEASTFYKTIVHIIKNNGNKLITEDLEAVLPELGEALGELGIDAATLTGEAVAEGTAVAEGAALGPVFLAVLAAIFIGYCIFKPIPGHTEELPRKVPPPLKGNINSDPISAAQMELLTAYLSKHMERPKNAGH